MKVRLLAIVFSIAGIAEGQPVVSSVLNAASYSEVLAPGSWIAIFGTGFASAEASAPGVPLLNMLGGVTVSVDGKPAPLLYVSATLIDALVPFEVPESDNRKTSVVVTTAQGISTPYSIYINRRAPVLFTRDASGSGPAHVFDLSFAPKSTVLAGDVVILYAGGLGPTSPPASTPSGGSAVEPLSRITDDLEVFVGEQKAEVLFAGLAPGFPGIYQVNVRVPALWTDRIYLRQGDWISNVAHVGIQAGTNVSSVVMAEFDRVFPSLAYSSLTFYGAQFRIQLDVRPDAKPFMLAVVGDTGGWFTRVDTANGMWESFITSTSFASNIGDFSASRSTVMDFGNGCSPFPGNKIPGGRLDPSTYYFTTYDVPPPDIIFPGNSAGAVSLYGPFPGIASGFIASGAFGDFLQLPCGVEKNHRAKFIIYVDGKAVASREVTYPVAGR